jgi:predicted small lipoprotein YifL
MRTASLALVLLMAAATLAACGRAGSIRPPGPPEQVTFPRVYPSR